MIPKLFRKLSTGNPQENPAVTKVEHELLLARIDRLESQMTGIKIEWEDVYDKITHLYDRTRKRIAALKKAEVRSDAPNGAQGDPEHTQPQTHADIMNMARQKGWVR